MAYKDSINKNEWRLFYDDLVSKIEDLSIRVSTSEIRNSPPSADQHRDWSDLKTVRDSNIKLAADLDLLRKEVTSLRGTNGKLKQDMAFVQSENASLRRDLDSLQTENKKLKASVSTQQREVDKLRQDMSSMQDDIVLVQSENTSLRRDVDTLQTKTTKSDVSPTTQQTHVDKLRHDMTSLQMENVALRHDVSELRQKAVGSNSDEWRTGLGKVNSQIDDIERKIAKSDVTVGFNAQLTTGDVRARDGDTIICNNVTNNDGGGYNSQTGVFTVPVSGLYCFMASTRPSEDDDGKVARFDIVTDKPDVVLTGVLSFGRHRGTCHRVKKVRAGQKIWLRAFGEGDIWFNRNTTTFTGMLLQPEL